MRVFVRTGHLGYIGSVLTPMLVKAGHDVDEDGYRPLCALQFARAVFPNPDLLLTAGQFGRMRIPGSEPYKAILIPDAAIVSDQSRKIVLTVNDDDGRAEDRTAGA